MPSAASDVTSGTDSDVAPRPAKASGALLVLGLAQFIMVIDTTIMNVSISNLVKDLHTTLVGVQSAITMYALVMAAFMITGGRLGDIIGRRRAFVLGILVYGSGSLLTAISWNLPVLLFGWSLLEGLGAALVMPAIISLVRSNFAEGRPRVAAYGAIGAIAAGAVAIGPIVGGLLTTYLTWRLAFAAEVVGILALVVLARRLRDAPREGARPKLDVPGVILSAAGMGIAVFGILQASTYGWLEARQAFSIAGVEILSKGSVSPVVVFVAIGLVLLVVFALREHRLERRGGAPLLRLSLFRARGVASGALTLMGQSFMQSGVFFVIPVFVQISLGYDAFHTGLVLLPVSLSLFAVALLAAPLAARFTPRRVIQAGLAITIAGSIVAAFTIDATASGTDFIPAMLLIGAGVGCVSSQLNNLVQSSVTPDQSSEASGVTNTFMNLGASLGTAVAGAMLIAGIIGSFNAQLADSTLPQPDKARLETALQGDVRAISNAQLESALTDEPTDVANEVVAMNERARNSGLRLAIIAIAVLGCLAFVVTFWLPKRGLESDAAASP